MNDTEISLMSSSMFVYQIVETIFDLSRKIDQCYDHAVDLIGSETV